MSRRGPAALALAAILGVLGHDDAWAHAGLRLSDPIAGATLGDTPTLYENSVPSQVFRQGGPAPRTPAAPAGAAGGQ